MAKELAGIVMVPPAFTVKLVALKAVALTVPANVEALTPTLKASVVPA